MGRLRRGTLTWARTIAPLSKAHMKEATRNTHRRKWRSHIVTTLCQNDLAGCHWQMPRAQEPSHDAASSAADGYICSSRSCNARHCRTSSSHRQAARRASNADCFRERCNSTRLGKRDASSPPRGTLPQLLWIPPSARFAFRAPWVSSQCNCSDSSSVSWRTSKARSIAGSQVCTLRVTISMRASLITSCNSNCVLNRASSIATAMQCNHLSCELGLASRQSSLGTAANPYPMRNVANNAPHALAAAISTTPSASL
mmetsp:Transcript_65745/g.189565  ORF Transcript_65745/g.189565 Transcript_65745/m.189565 type:complete len:256 (-) Transcript_65745:481-1248(-)